jgi:hypothetical protein
MALEIKQHIKLQSENPLDAIVDGHPRVKAYLVASLAIKEGVEAAVEQYKDFNLSVAAVHAALTFYYDNQEAIRKADEEAMRKLRAMGMQDMDEFVEEIRRRKQSK